MSSLVDLRRFSLPELESMVAERGLPAFRYRQMARWLYGKAAASIDEMTDLSLDLRTELSRDYEVGGLEVVAERTSQVDRTRKFLFRLQDGRSVESVLMPLGRRYTLCISSQVGCTLDCVFCDTGRMGFLRNLEAWEIVGQVIPLWREIRAERDDKVRTNIVFMGMGEPLHNTDAVIEACRLLTDPLGLHLRPKGITVSTAGGIAGMRKLADSGLGVRLAVSLNATTQEERERLMPKAAKVPLLELVAAARDYAERTNDRATMEYVLMRGVNDRPEDADRLGDLFRGGPFKINLIPYNPGGNGQLERPDREAVDAFARRLYPQAPVVTVRWSMGPDIAAACGQLKTEVERTTPPAA
ncbi:MAG: dual-specificity RNA methyltransferase RlmN [Gemmatimonadota bacterium]|nr:MAG: dual-specificity RNA methyltransferase RlmN [Gemmatimonadota bacterium]